MTPGSRNPSTATTSAWPRALKMNGDLEVFFGLAEAEALRDALTEAIETTGG